MKIIMHYVPRQEYDWRGDMSTDAAWLTDGCALVQVGDVSESYRPLMARRCTGLRRVGGEDSRAVWDRMLSLRQFTADPLGTMECTKTFCDEEDPESEPWIRCYVRFTVKEGSGVRFVVFDADRLQFALDATCADEFVIAFATGPVAIGKRRDKPVFVLTGIVHAPPAQEPAP